MHERYERIVKSLRFCMRLEEPAFECIEMDGGCCDSIGRCIPHLMDEAADAIEELVAMMRTDKEFLEQYGGETGIKNLNEFAGKYWDLLKNTPRWIPVKKHLPKTRESILGKKSSKVIVAFRFDDGTQGTDTAHTLNGEWVFEDHITVVPRTITHWMPLPEPPKEEYDC